MPRRILATLLAVLVLAAALAWLGYTQTTATGTVTVSVTGYIAATPLDSASVIDVNPATAKTLSYGGLAVWAGINATDDMIFNMTGTNVNLTVGYTYSITLPPSYPTGLKEPYVGLFTNITTSSTSQNITATVQVFMQNYTITLNPAKTYLLSLYLTAGAQLTWIDLPEGFLNAFYGKEYNETQWYNFTYAAKVTIPAISILYNPATGTFTVANQTSLCVLLVDPDNSLYRASQVSGDEMVIVGVNCNFDADASNSTIPAVKPPSPIDLAVNASDYAVPGGTAVLGINATIYYEYNQTAYTLLNFTIGYPGGIAERGYFRVQLSIDTSGIHITLIPVYPVPYAAVLGPLYAAGSYPYLHAWPAILLPVGAPAGTYKATVYIQLEQT